MRIMIKMHPYSISPKSVPILSPGSMHDTGSLGYWMLGAGALG